MQKSFRIFKYPFAHSSRHEPFPLVCIVVLQLLLHVSKDRYPPSSIFDFPVSNDLIPLPNETIAPRFHRERLSRFLSSRRVSRREREKSKRKIKGNKKESKKEGISCTKRSTCYIGFTLVAVAVSAFDSWDF